MYRGMGRDGEGWTTYLPFDVDIGVWAPLSGFHEPRATSNDNSEPIDPGTARELHLDHKRPFRSDATVRGHQYRTKPIEDWCDEQGIDKQNELRGASPPAQRPGIWTVSIRGPIRANLQ